MDNALNPEAPSSGQVARGSLRTVVPSSTWNVDIPPGWRQLPDDISESREMRGVVSVDDWNTDLPPDRWELPYDVAVTREFRGASGVVGSDTWNINEPGTWKAIPDDMRFRRPTALGYQAASAYSGLPEGYNTGAVVMAATGNWANSCNTAQSKLCALDPTGPDCTATCAQLQTDVQNDCTLFDTSSNGDPQISFDARCVNGTWIGPCTSLQGVGGLTCSATGGGCTSPSQCPSCPSGQTPTCVNSVCGCSGGGGSDMTLILAGVAAVVVIGAVAIFSGGQGTAT